MIFAKLKDLNPRDENELQNVMKRGYEVKGPTQAINTFFADDTDQIFCKVNRYDYHKLSKTLLENGRKGKSLFAIKGTVPPDFRMIKIKQIKYLGEME